MRLPDEVLTLVSADVLQPSSIKTYRDIFPLSGEGWRKIRLTFHNTLAGAGSSVPNDLGSFLFIKNISLKTSRNENPISISGSGMYHLNWLLDGVQPLYTPGNQAAGTYHATIDIPFIFPFLSRKEDLALDSGRYTSIELSIQTGSISDLVRTPSTDTLATTLDISLIRNKSAYEESGKPIASVYIKELAPFQAVTKGYADIESAEDLILFGFMAVAHDLVTWGAVGNAFEGDEVDCLDNISFYDNLVDWIKDAKIGHFQTERALYSNNRAFTGVYPHVFTKEGSYKGGLPTGNRSEIKFKIGNGNVGTPTTPQVDLILFGTRELR